MRPVCSSKVRNVKVELGAKAMNNDGHYGRAN